MNVYMNTHAMYTCTVSQNLLALGSEDRTLTISNCEGDTLRTVSCSNVHVYVCTSAMLSILGKRE